MKKIFAGILAVSIAVAASAQEPDQEVPDNGFTFRDKKTIRTTDVKDQNKSGTCWSFAGISFFEEEIMRAGGDALNLSEMFVVRHCYADKADKYVRMYGNTTFSPGGSILDIPYVIEHYGIVPEEVYHGLNYGEAKHAHYEMDGILSDLVKNVVKKPMGGKISTAWKKALNGVLDAYLGELPETFTYKGTTYTPLSFAKSLGLDMDNYVGITSFTHHPFYKPFVLEVADNWLWGEYMNLPLEDMQAVIDNALENSYSVAWAADISEGGFKWIKGVALMPKGKDEGDMTGTELSRWVILDDKDRQDDKYNFDGPVDEIEVTQELRQQMFDAQETTDDHGMVIVGYAFDQEGNKYYKVKNSWDTNQIYGGYLYASEAFVLAKTINIYVNKAAVPVEIAMRAGIM